MMNYIEYNKNKIIDTIKLLIYKENPSILEKVNFDDDDIFLEPLLFAYFNCKNENLFSSSLLNELIQGYFIQQESLILRESFNNEGVAYVPNLGYFDNQCNKIDDIFKVQNTTIEILIHPIVHLNTIFKDLNENVINENKIEISKTSSLKHEKALKNAFQFIKNSNNEQYNLIEQCCKKIVLFKTDPENTNSFATINAHGIAFFNVYQEEYDEVFFIDDIAHQTGHIILTTILFERKKYFIIDENSNIKTITKNDAEYRSFYILFHALFTYYTTLLCLDACLENISFDKRQSDEIKGRIGFYLLKYKSDLSNFQQIVSHFGKIEHVLTNSGIDIYKKIEDKYFEIYHKYSNEVGKFNYANQPYNFTFKNFIEQNQI